ncbi:MAG: aspartyl-trna synthetase [Rhodobacterales bacterium]|nr:aspartyl-trna synthetase [Rhodobacterales bacterium]
MTLAFALLLPLLGAGLGPALAQEAAPAPGQAAQGASGLPLPRYVSLRADEVNMRAGPGVQYPVNWVYKRRLLPLEVIAEYHAWRKVRDYKGTEGWMHKNMLSGRRTAVVTGDLRTLREDPDSRARPVIRAEVGVVAELRACPDGSEWCEVIVGGRTGWLRRFEIWGVYPEEAVD